MNAIERHKKDRWVNWDHLAEGDDFWDMMEGLDEKRLCEIREQEQMEKLREKGKKRLDSKLSDEYIQKGISQGEPYLKQIQYEQSKKKAV